MRKWVLTLALAVAAAFLFVGFGIAAPTAFGIESVVVAGNPTCSDLNGFEASAKFDPPVDGSKSGITIDVTGKTLSWLAAEDVLVQAVIVKGGPNANVYFYAADGPLHTHEDSGLTTPTNPSNNKPYGLSHVDFCFDVKDH